MQIKKALIFMTVVLLIMFAAGCNSRGTAPVQRAENNQQGVDIENGDSSRVQEADLEYGEITDPVELEKLWQDYLYDTITTLGNASNFNSAEEIEPFYVAKYCWYKYAAEHGEEGLELANENSLSGRFFPLETVLEYAGRYFN
ncbi:MAG: hypothetical protein GX039_04345, partial [Clostridia bacterium]|nr:hypothetical protein [Clostridia bacterium]